MRYDYQCQSCGFVFEQKHGMTESPKVSCPKCSGECKKMMPTSVECWVRGNGIVKDKCGAYRDMHLHTLQKYDPYAKMRQPGEKEELVDRLRKAGKRHDAVTKIIDGKVCVKCKCGKKKTCKACHGMGYVPRDLQAGHA